MEDRTRKQSLRHEVGNMLMVAQANLEAMLDGVVDTTHERLEAVRDALATASERLKDLATLLEEEE